MKALTGEDVFKTFYHQTSRLGEHIMHGFTDTIICGELYRQGLITNRQKRYGMMFGREVGEEVYQGYLIAAAPIVTRMQRSKMFTRFIAFFAIPTVREIAHRTNPREKGSILGAIVLHFGIPHCLRTFDEHVGSFVEEVA